jgi:hypothetical protein
MRIGKKPPKKQDSIVLNVKELMQKLESNRNFKANRRRGPGTREKVSLRRINLECNTYVQEINVSQLPV